MTESVAPASDETTHTPASAAGETHAFQAETRQVLHLMIHSLYSNKEIFLRELVSNASDALDRLRFQAIQHPEYLPEGSELGIEIEADPAARTLIIRDNGIGMNREEVLQNIGTIARSGTREFLSSLGDSERGDAHLIGQFGVGFYSAFIVADEVALTTRRAGDAAGEAVRWQSDGGGEFRLAEAEKSESGTEICLHLKDTEDEFLQEWTLRSLIGRYSDHIAFPIRLRVLRADQDDSDTEAGEAGESDWQQVNKATALWNLPKSEISDEDYQSFYRHVSHDGDDALAWTHNRVEGVNSYITLLYVPRRAPFDLMLQRDERHGLKLYVNRVFIMDAAQQLLPQYLRFIRGVVDSQDLPLNVSRELLQENELLGKIRSAVVRRSLDLLEKLATDQPDEYAGFWKQFGSVLKEGVVEDFGNRERILKLLRFASTQDESAGPVVDLPGYVARMREGQEAIYYITAENPQAARRSPHLEVFRRKGIEVLLMSDRVDEWMMSYLHEFDSKPLRSVAKGALDLDALADDESGAEASKAKDLPEDFLQRVAAVLADSVSEVRTSKRLTESASCLVLDEQEMALHLQQMLRQAGQEVPQSRPALELNPGHALVRNLLAEPESDQAQDLIWLLFEQAVLAEGGDLPDPVAHISRVNSLLMARASSAPSGETA